ncbi:hypothetical protein ACQ858_08250 [Variovorax ureilyticus]
MSDPDDFACTTAEDLDFIGAAGLLSAAALLFLFYGDDIARFLNSLLIGL